MGTKNHNLYKRSSPYYQGILASEGRYLSPAVTRSILRDHSVAEDEYLGDPMVALGALPAKTDAADLLAFLGY